MRYARFGHWLTQALCIHPPLAYKYVHFLHTYTLENTDLFKGMHVIIDHCIAKLSQPVMMMMVMMDTMVIITIGIKMMMMRGVFVANLTT